ncbi:DNA polymerase I [Pseudofulvimonas gallinarii]|jgi:DNA polymerase-1|uniref:DNA polymerase I n=1 Tax=Pseudofulvimonas gallinarii TaxID=634155 RepID=A0A4R3LJE1_9GAMM|nr:DNA polymerase I [Pseudofulvimonas gallinarii]TCT00293.1 DNA polymerase I [Pseudofulvimonas gallinarii]THD14135.1 DNA polymerase I [Pseudofulvimonas gallinarii]
MSTLLLIDGSSYLFRAFHALPPLTNREGEPTGALFGVFNMLRKHLADRPDHVAVVFDASGPTFREELDPQYKANRPPMPDDLRVQIEPLHALVRALGLPLLRIEGVEADDVIGTLARQGAAAGLQVTISTSDKDFAQLVDDRIGLVNTMSGSALDRDGVIGKFGVPPERIIDYLALMGDSIDNVPGVEKCGPKTAAKWLAEFGSLDAIMAAADTFKGKLGENLRTALPRLPLNRELVTIRTDVPLELGPGQLRPGEPDREALRQIYTRYGFTAALRELDGGGAVSETAGAPAATGAAAVPTPAGDSIERHYDLVLDEATWAGWLQRLRDADCFAFDTETTGLDPQRATLVGLSLAVAPGIACYVPLAHDGPGVAPQLPAAKVLADLAPLLADPMKKRVAQNGKYDLHILRRAGIEVADVTFDTMLESYVFNATATRHDMDSLAARYLGVTTIKYDDVTGKGSKRIGFSQVDLGTATRYAAEDADVTLRLHQVLWPLLQDEPGPRDVFTRIEMPLVPVLGRVEANGVLIDRDMLVEQGRHLRQRMLELEQQAHAMAGRAFSLDSPKQLQAILYQELGLPVAFKTATGQPSTNEEALDALADQHPLPRVILDYRSLAKLVSTYTDKLIEQINPDTGRVHTCYHQAVAATGRLSSSDPNLQNIPVRSEEGRRIRQAFIAPPGWKILAADYSQIELRIMAHLSDDEGLLAAFRSGLDIHRATAAEVLGKPLDEVSANERRAAKAVNFGLIYGMGAFGLARQLGIDRGEAQHYIDRYFARYPGVRAFMESTREQARERGHVETVFGRRLYLNDIRARNANLRQAAERAAINAPMQGTAADIIKRAMIDLDACVRRREFPAKMIMQVHDELVFEVREDALEEARALITERMCAAAELKIPLVVDAGIGDNWDQAH